MMRPTSACTVARCSEPRGFDSNGGGKVGVLDLLVAFECDAVEHGRFGHVHDQPLAGAFDGNLVEQAGCNQRFQRRVARGVVELPIRRRVKVGAHGLSIDAAIALDGDRCRCARLARFRRRQVARKSSRERREPASRQPRSDRSVRGLRDALAHHVLPDSY